MSGSTERISSRASFSMRLEGNRCLRQRWCWRHSSSLGNLEPLSCHPHHHPPDPFAFHLEEGVECWVSCGGWQTRRAYAVTSGALGIVCAGVAEPPELTWLKCTNHHP
jgi:hypothetical protein